MTIHSTNATTADYRAYTEAFRAGVRSAALTREVANAHAHAMPVKDGDAFLAGYDAEKRKLRADHEDFVRADRRFTQEWDSASYRSAMIDAGRGRLLR